MEVDGLLFADVVTTQWLVAGA